MKVGVLGGGQLGRMLALAGYPLGLEFVFVDPNPRAPAGAVGKLVVAEYDSDAARSALTSTEVVTFEFENVPARAARDLPQRTPLFPPARALEMAQDRLAEKSCFAALGIPTARFEPVSNEVELGAALAHTGVPAVLKTRRQGYDGKGQAVVERAEDASGALQSLGEAAARHGCIVEQKVGFDRELSVIAVRSTRGEVRFYPLIENHHRGGILDFSLAPAPDVSAELQRTAEEYAGRLMDELGYAGVLTLELFQAGSELLVNECAPRVHNSGHLTIEGATTSQFENHLRAVLGWPLGATQIPSPAVMLNLIGTLPDRQAMLEVEGAHFHDYGKSPREGRKLGHVTLVRSTVEAALAGLDELRRHR